MRMQPQRRVLARTPRDPGAAQWAPKPHSFASPLRAAAMPSHISAGTELAWSHQMASYCPRRTLWDHLLGTQTAQSPPPAKKGGGEGREGRREVGGRENTAPFLWNVSTHIHTRAHTHVRTRVQPHSLHTKAHPPCAPVGCWGYTTSFYTSGSAWPGTAGLPPTLFSLSRPDWIIRHCAARPVWPSTAQDCPSGQRAALLTEPPPRPGPRAGLVPGAREQVLGPEDPGS